MKIAFTTYEDSPAVRNMFDLTIIYNVFQMVDIFLCLQAYNTTLSTGQEIRMRSFMTFTTKARKRR